MVAKRRPRRNLNAVVTVMVSGSTPSGIWKANTLPDVLYPLLLVWAGIPDEMALFAAGVEALIWLLSAGFNGVKTRLKISEKISEKIGYWLVSLILPGSIPILVG